jgi:group I intron endonuclease
MLTSSYCFQVIKTGVSNITRARISASLTGRSHTSETKALMSLMRTGPKNPFFGKSLSQKTLDAAVMVTGTPIYVYDVGTFTLINGTPFRSIRETEKHMPIGASTLPRKLDTNKPFKGYFYLTFPQVSKLK